MQDVIIVGAGPAGLSAALILGRCLRQVLVFDHGHPRNSYAHNIHGFLSQHAITPAEFTEKSRTQLAHFENVKIKKAEVVAARKSGRIFEVTLSNGETYAARKLLLATGVVDEIPKIDGLRPLYGQSVFQCAYCDGWEFRDQPIAVLGEGDRGFNSVLFMKTWSRDLVVCTNGGKKLTAAQVQTLRDHEIEIRNERITRLDGENGQLQFVEFEKGPKLPRKALFFNTPSFIRSSLLDQLACPFSETGGVEIGRYETTKIPGLFAAGNIIRDVQLVIVAAAEGAQAAFGINAELTQENLRRAT